MDQYGRMEKSVESTLSEYVINKLYEDEQIVGKLLAPTNISNFEFLKFFVFLLQRSSSFTPWLLCLHMRNARHTFRGKRF